MPKRDWFDDKRLYQTGRLNVTPYTLLLVRQLNKLKKISKGDIVSEALLHYSSNLPLYISGSKKYKYDQQDLYNLRRIEQLVAQTLIDKYERKRLMRKTYTVNNLRKKEKEAQDTKES